MFDRFKRWVARDIIETLNIRNQELNKDIRDLEDEVEELESSIIEQSNPEPENLPLYYMNKLIEGGAQWYDYMQLEQSLLEEYKRRAEILRTNDVFLNEINFLINTYSKRALTEAKTAEDIRDYRMQCLGLADLRTRISEIPKAKEEKPKAQDPFDTI